MLAAEMIERSVSPWYFPMVIVKKADGSNRPYVDYRALNSKEELLSITAYSWYSLTAW